MGAVSKAQAERAEALFVGTSGQVLVAKSTGVPVPKTLKGDATLAEDGTLTVGDGAITSRKVKLTTFRAAATTTKSLTEAYVLVPGVKTELTPAVSGSLLIVGSAMIEAREGSTAEAALFVNGGAQPMTMAVGGNVTNTPATMFATCGQNWIIPVEGGVPYVVELRAKRVGGAGGNAYLTGTCLSGLLIAA
jgi:hypothetical protein